MSQHLSSATPRTTWPRRLRRMLITLAIAYVLWLVLLFLLQRQLLFPRTIANAHYAPPPSFIEKETLTADDGTTIDAFVLRQRGEGQSPAVVLLHGNAMLANDWFEWATSLHDRGWTVVIPEFRGYGQSAGSPSRDALVADTAMWLDALGSDPAIDHGRIAVYGRSIGGAIGAEAAAKAKRPPAGLALQTTPDKLASFAWRYGAPPFLVRDPFDTSAAVATLRRTGQDCSFLVIVHANDEIVPAAHSAAITAAAAATPVVAKGTHNEYASPMDELTAEDAIARWLDGVRMPRH